MSDAFGRAAARRFGIAARLLGWRPHEFWGATPAEFAGAFAAPDAPEAGLDRATLRNMMENDDGDDRR